MKAINFSKMGGLVPAIIQDVNTDKVLMLGFMSPEAYERTKETGYVYFWSRTRQALWMKGETSGNKLKVAESYVDCDDDTFLFKVTIEGDGVCCHTGAETCFVEGMISGTEKVSV